MATQFWGLTKPVTPNQVVRMLMARPINEPAPPSLYIFVISKSDYQRHSSGALVPYQPKVDVKDNRVVGFESLARWRDKKTDQVYRQLRLFLC